MSSTDDPVPQDLRDQVCALWRRVVAEPNRGTFTDCGGDSLSGLRLIGAVYGLCGVRMTWEDLHEAADAEDFAERVTAAASA
ncbi:acyl carrier protein [Streptosporangium canum]|uniref:acyl carrier protein n=1 Tax=Streptosporangium canum TaxID=324952 RepID=UPI003674C3A6